MTRGEDGRFPAGYNSTRLIICGQEPLHYFMPARHGRRILWEAAGGDMAGAVVRNTSRWPSQRVAVQ